MPPYDPALIEGLRGRIRALERPQAAGPALSLAPEIDAHLPGRGLAQGALHEILAVDPGPATLFAAAAARATPGAILWCRRGQTFDAGSLCPAGLAAIGLDPRRLLLVNTRKDDDALWAMEEALRARVAVVAELGVAPLTATRRLALAAEAGGAPAFILRRDESDPPPSAATTRWRISATPSRSGRARIRAELFRCRGAGSATWLMEWNDETRRLAVVAALHDRAADPAPARLAG
jgi:protein ImuA